MAEINGKSWVFDKTVRINDIIKWILLIGTIVGGYVRLEYKIEKHLSDMAIHKSISEYEKIFVRKEIAAKDKEIIQLKLDEINKKLDILIKVKDKGE